MGNSPLVTRAGTGNRLAWKTLGMGIGNGACKVHAMGINCLRAIGHWGSLEYYTGGEGLCFRVGTQVVE